MASRTSFKLKGSNCRFREPKPQCIYHLKVSTVSTLLIINNLSVYKTPYIFCEVFTSLVINNLSVYTIVKGTVKGCNIEAEADNANSPVVRIITEVNHT
jgi:hypothetical protein